MPREPQFDRTERLARVLSDVLMLRPIATPRKLQVGLNCFLVYIGVLFVGQIAAAVYIQLFEGGFGLVGPLGLISWLLIVVLTIALVRFVLRLAADYLSRHSERFHAAE